MLLDTGGIMAILDAAEPRHHDCRKALLVNGRPGVTTMACLAEVMHLAGRRGGYPMQAAAWEMFLAGHAVLHHPRDAAEVRRMRILMRDYRDRPMDLADASLVAAAEVLRDRRVLSLDSDFRVYRLADGSASDVVPPLSP